MILADSTFNIPMALRLNIIIHMHILHPLLLSNGFTTYKAIVISETHMTDRPSLRGRQSTWPTSTPRIVDTGKKRLQDCFATVLYMYRPTDNGDCK